VAFLVKQGADPELKNKRGQSPLAIATPKGIDAITNLLRVSQPGK
jgi:ankyrin repeat protein